MAFVIVAISSVSRAQTSAGPAQSARSGQGFELRHTAVFPRDTLSFGELAGYDTVHLPGCDSLTASGRPKLPAQTARIALPAGMAVTNVRVIAEQPVKVPGAYVVYPAQPPTPITDPPRRASFVPPDPLVYGSPDAYPGKLAELVHQTDLAGQGIAIVRLYPVQYAPDTKELTLYTSMTILLVGIEGYECGDYLPPGISMSGRRAYRRMLDGMVVNPDDVALTMSSEPTPASRGVGPGEYEYVIITHSDWVDDFVPLRNWRTKTGIPATIVTTDWIYNEGGYVGSDVEQTRAFVEDAHTNWGATYFLLGADTDVIPCHVRTITIPGYGTFDIANDTYYADYDEDWICEVHVGRASARSTAAIGTFINKVFTYEKSPPSTGYVKTAAFFGFDIVEPGDQFGETSKEEIRDLYLPVGWALDTEYDSEPGTHRADLLAYLNDGNHLVNHHDHCDWYCMGAGWISHGDLIYTSEVDELANADRQSILFAVGCYSCDISVHTSIGEAFVQNPDGGGIAFMGNSCIGWGGIPEDPNWYSARQDAFFYRNLFDDGFVRLGENFSDLKNDEYDPDDPYNVHQHCFTQLHLLGDPGVPVWTEDPQGLTVTHEDTLIAGEYVTFPVEVYSGGSPVDGAAVCLWKLGDVYEVAETIAGMATFEFTPAGSGEMHVTVSGHNYLPYEGQAIVRGDPIPTVSEWGMAAMTLLALTAGTLVFTRQRPASPPTH